MGAFRPAALLLGLLAHVSAQGIGDLPSHAGCDLAVLPGQVATLNAHCCPGGSCGCTIACSTELLPLLDTCRPMLDALLDMDDGVRVRHALR